MAAENIALAKEAKQDSATIAKLEKAYYVLDSSFRQCRESLYHQQTIIVDCGSIRSQLEQEQKSLKKEIRKQKFTKWLGWGVATLLAVVAIAK